MDTPNAMTILTVLALFGYLWWWGRQPNTILDKIVDRSIEDGYEPDDSKPVLKAPVYDFRKVAQESLPQEPVEDDPIVAARAVIIERPVAVLHEGSRSSKAAVTSISSTKDNDTKVFTRPDAPVTPVVALLSKYGKNALSDSMSIEDLRTFVHDMVAAGYELKKVWPNKGTQHIAYMIFKE